MPYYRILDKNSGRVELRRCEHTHLGPALRSSDQAFANQIVDEIQEACRYFYEVDPPTYEGCEEIEGVSDDEVERRIAKIDLGENTREAEREASHHNKTSQRYPLVELPFQRKRALIEHIERIKNFWQFSFVSLEEEEELQAEEIKRRTTSYWDDPRSDIWPP